jgi:SSS family solute:Na+ symporter
MSTVSGALNSVATLFSYDLVKRFRPGVTDRKLVIIGRIATFLGMLAAIFWSPMVGRFETVFQGFAALICYIAPPVFAVFVLGVFWKGASSRGAIVTLIVGSALGLGAFLLDFFKEQTGWSMNFWMAGFYLGMICLAIHLVVSLVTREELTEEKGRLVWAHPLDALRSPGWPGAGNYKFLAVVLMVAMVALYVVFA